MATLKEMMEAQFANFGEQLGAVADRQSQLEATQRGTPVAGDASQHRYRNSLWGSAPSGMSPAAAMRAAESALHNSGRAPGLGLLSGGAAEGGGAAGESGGALPALAQGALRGITLSCLGLR